MIAHRGGGSIAPENTIAGLAAAADAGYGAVEFDVMLSADGVPVLIHDEALGRTVTGQALVAELDAAALCAMDAGSWLDSRFGGEPVPLYKAALDYCVAHKMWMNVEIKPSAGHERATGATVARLTRQWLGDDAAGQVLFSSFSVLALEAALEAAPDIPRGWLLRTVPADWPEVLKRLKVRSVHWQSHLVDATLADAVHALGYGLFCYTVNTPAELKRLSALGVDALCTDRIDLFAPDAFPSFPG